MHGGKGANTLVFSGIPKIPDLTVPCVCSIILDTIIPCSSTIVIYPVPCTPLNVDTAYSTVNMINSTFCRQPRERCFFECFRHACGPKHGDGITNRRVNHQRTFHRFPTSILSNMNDPRHGRCRSYITLNTVRHTPVSRQGMTLGSVRSTSTHGRIDKIPRLLRASRKHASPMIWIYLRRSRGHQSALTVPLRLISGRY